MRLFIFPCAGKAGLLPLNLYARVRFLLCTLHTRPRVQRAPGLPCALCCQGGTDYKQTSGASRREIANAHPLTVIARESGRSSIPEALMIEPRSRRVLDSP